tara:strand:- start:11935 stop:12324 length:390 start_codon:yes stop_codon:yes gene_type:complete
MALVSKSFRDFSLTFEKNAVTNDVLSLKDAAAIKAAVKNIVLYNFYEKPFDPAFGGNIIGLLFENYTSGLATEIEERITNAIQIHEPRVAVYEVEADWEEDRNELNVSVSYIILGLTPKIDDISIAFKP